MSIRIRSVQPADAKAVQAIYAPFVSDRATSFETVPPDAVEMRRRIDEQLERHPWLVAETDGDVIGYACASAHRTRSAYRWSVDVAVYVDPRLHRRGIGRALYASLFDLLRRQRFVNAYAGITLPNPSSVALHQSLGFEPIGTYRGVGFKLDRWHDVIWMHLRLRQDAKPVGEPLTTEHLWDDPEVIAMLRERALGVQQG
jgi:phosphinothricin acetyltransferase